MIAIIQSLGKGQVSDNMSGYSLRLVILCAACKSESLTFFSLPSK